MTNFHALEVVGRGSETQLQVGENSNYLIKRFKGYGLQQADCGNQMNIRVSVDWTSMRSSPI